MPERPEEEIRTSTQTTSPLTMGYAHGATGCLGSNFEERIKLEQEHIEKMRQQNSLNHQLVEEWERQLRNSINHQLVEEWERQLSPYAEKKRRESILKKLQLKEGICELNKAAVDESNHETTKAVDDLVLKFLVEERDNLSLQLQFLDKLIDKWKLI